VHETALNANISHLSSKYCICLTSDSSGRILSVFALVPLSNESTKRLACLAWRFRYFLSNLSASTKSDKAAKTSRNPPGSLWLRRIWRSLSRLHGFLSTFKLPKNRQAMQATKRCTEQSTTSRRLALG